MCTVLADITTTFSPQASMTGPSSQAQQADLVASNSRSLQWQMVEAATANQQQLPKPQKSSTPGNGEAEAALPNLDWTAADYEMLSDDSQSVDQPHPGLLGNAGITVVPERGDVASAVQQSLSFVADIFRRNRLGAISGVGNDGGKGADGDTILPSAQLEILGDDKPNNPTERRLTILPFIDWNNAILANNMRKSNVTSDKAMATPGNVQVEHTSNGALRSPASANQSKAQMLQSLSKDTLPPQQQQLRETLAQVLAMPGMLAHSNALQPRLSVDDTEVPLLYTNSMADTANPPSSPVQPIQFIPTPGLSTGLRTAEPGTSRIVPVKEASAVLLPGSGTQQHLDAEVDLIPTAATGGTDVPVMEAAYSAPPIISNPIPDMSDRESLNTATAQDSSVAEESKSSVMEDNGLGAELPSVPSLTTPTVAGSRLGEHVRPLLTAADARAQRSALQGTDAKPATQTLPRNTTAKDHKSKRLSGWVIGAIAAGCFVGVISLFGIVLLARAIKIRRQQLAEYDLHSCYMQHENSADQLTDPAAQPYYYYYDEQGVLQYALYPDQQDDHRVTG
jgi:hypothetical protein